MLVNHLFESVISENLALEAWQIGLETIKSWTNKSFPLFLDKIGYTEQMHNILDQEPTNEKFRNANGKVDYDAFDKASQKWSNERDQVSEEINDKLDRADEDEIEDIRGASQLIRDFIDTVEISLQDLTKKYVEDKFGKIDPFVGSGNYDEESKKHLYWLQHILVHITTNAVNRNEKPKPKTGGGFFSKFPNEKDFTEHQTSQREVDWKNDLKVGIVIHSSKAKIWEAVRYLLKARLYIKLYAEDLTETKPAEIFLTEIIPTYVHEVGHLEQDIRRQITGKWSRDQGITYLPTPGEKRKTIKKFSATGPTKKVRVGRRGDSDRLGNDEWGNEPRVANYYGTRHEIDAHAASTASALIINFLKEHNRYYRSTESATEKQIAINQAVDDILETISYGLLPYGADDVGRSTGAHSFERYRALVQGKINQIKQRRDAQGNLDPARRRYPLPKVDVLGRKVWRIYMLSLVKQLLAYKKPIEWKDDDWRQEDHKQARKSKVGNITHPAKTPNLP